MRLQDWENYLFKFVDYFRKKNFSERYVDSMIFGLNKFYKFLIQNFKIKAFKLKDISREMIESYQNYLTNSKLNINSVGVYLQKVKDFFKFMAKERFILFNPAEAIIMPKVVRGLPKRIPTIAEMEKILEIPDLSKFNDYRDRAILELMYSTGIRIGEVVKINLYDIDLNEGYLRVQGKGKKERVVPVGKIACEFVKNYLENIRPKFVRSKRLDEQGLFLTSTGGKRLSLIQLSILIRRHIRKAGFKFNPHSIRHAFATHLLQRGAKIKYIQRMLGHSLISTTQVYTNVVQSDLKRVHNQTHPEAKKTEIIRFEG